MLKCFHSWHSVHPKYLRFFGQFLCLPQVAWNFAQSMNFECFSKNFRNVKLIFLAELTWNVILIVWNVWISSDNALFSSYMHFELGDFYWLFAYKSVKIVILFSSFAGFSRFFLLCPSLIVAFFNARSVAY